MPDVNIRYSMVKGTRLFDCVDKTPAANEVEHFLLASKKYHLPIPCGGWFYMLGHDEALLIKNLKITSTLGSKIHNIQLFSHNTSGKPISNQDVADFYEFALKQGGKLNVDPCL
tara:strand:+ start:268 stop:609 length:342 start_codon:yes stop_codon:yes gene_type:complete